MFIDDLRVDFYDVIRGNHILLLVNQDIDAICSCKILQNVFRSDSIIYTLVPVEGVQDLTSAYKRYAQQVKRVILVNCGGTIDLVETLQPDEDVIFFVVDSHRPTDVCNVYSRSQVRLLWKPEEAENIPQFEEIFDDEESDEESDLLNEDEIERRRKRRAWKEKRDNTMITYTQFSYYGRCSSMVMYDVAWNLGKDDTQTLWCGIVGLTYQVLFGLIVPYKYTCELQSVQLHLARLTAVAESQATTKKETYHISCQKDLMLVLYRHWTIQASLRHTMYSAVKLKLWTLKGEKLLLKLLAEMGLPLCDSKQNYSSIDAKLKSELFSMIETAANNHGMEDLIYQSFLLTLSYRHSYQAADYVHAMVALLCASNTPSKKDSDRFLQALDCLSKNKIDLMEKGIAESKHLFNCVLRLVQYLITMKQITSAGPFFYFVLDDGAVDSKYFSTPTSLYLLARYSLYAVTSSSVSRKNRSLPLIASASCDDNNCLILGIPPKTEFIPRNFFGKAFEQAFDVIESEPVSTYFDSSVIKLSKRDRAKFFDALATILH